MKKILVLGGQGYIGSGVCQYLRANGCEVTSVDLMWFNKNPTTVDNLIIDYKNLPAEFFARYDAVILWAGHSSVKMCETDLLSSFNNNVRNFVTLMMKLNPDQMFIYASSSSVYGNVSAKSVDETYIGFIPNNYYDLTKQTIDQYAQLSKHRNWYALRLGTVCGGGPHIRNDVMMNAMYDSALINGYIKLFNPDIHRPILSLRELTAAVYRIIETNDTSKHGIYNLASFNTTSGNIAQAVSDILKIRVELLEASTVSTSKLDSRMYDFSIDTTKFCNTFNFEFKDAPEDIVGDLKFWHSKAHLSNRSSLKEYA